jgi:hypothetical protein
LALMDQPTSTRPRFTYAPPEYPPGRLSRIGAWARRGEWATWKVIVALLLGLTIGGVSFSASSLRPELEGVRKDLQGWQAFAAALQQQVFDLADDNNELLAQLEAKRPLPDLVGSTQQEVEALAKDLGWRVAIRERESGKGVGTVLSQEPSAGTLMHLGARLTIVVATPRS